MPIRKYKNVPTICDGIRFDSKKEANRYAQLKILEKARVIQNLELQVKIPLQVNGKHLGYYVADFVYMQGNKKIVEDVKSSATKTAVYRLKKKILATYNPPIVISEFL